MDPIIQNLLMEALRAQQQGDLAAAEAACRKVLDINENQADALQFLGLIEEAKGNIDEGKRLMERSLAVNPAQPHVLNNLANLLHDKGESEKAIALLEKATRVSPGFADAWYTLGKCFYDKGDYEKAVQALEQALKFWPHPEPLPNWLLGRIKLRERNFEAADQNFKAALAKNSGHFPTLIDYGISLNLQEKPGEALQHFEKAGELNPSFPELHLNKADALYQTGNLDEAIISYRKAISLKPDLQEAHLALNELLWRIGRKDLYGVSYKEAIQKEPKSIPLRVIFLESLLKTDSFDEFFDLVEESLKLDPKNDKLWRLKAKYFFRYGRFEDSLKALEKSAGVDPDNIETLRDMALTLIKQGNFQKAQTLLEKARTLSPLNQEILAYLGLCWQALGNPKADWLFNFNDFVKSYLIPTPPGYKNLSEFNRILNSVLNDFHQDKDQPSDQTLRRGTQSVAGLLDKNIKEIRELRASLEKTISRFISSLPEDPENPFLARKCENFTFENSWSIRLKDKGFHINHVHTDGWISSSYYVSVPPETKVGKEKPGWIKFGESPLDLGPKERIGKFVQPEEGLVVLFPSYMFHGTIPFHSAETRTTVPFDVVPD